MATPKGPSMKGRADSTAWAVPAMAPWTTGSTGRSAGQREADVVEQLVLDLFAHDEDDAVEAGGKGVARRVVHERLAAGPDGARAASGRRSGGRGLLRARLAA